MTPRFVFVMGPTAAGKSALALKAAQRFSADIVNCDSVQVYEKLQIGAAKPSFDELKIRPHHLYSFVPLEQQYGAGEYRRAFFSWADDFSKKAQEQPPRAFVVGGTGFYFQAIEKGMYPTRPSFPEIREELEQALAAGRAETLYQELKSKDPEAARRISPNDHYRLGRALEIVRGEGRSLTEIQNEFASKQEPFPYPVLKIGVSMEREALRAKIYQRAKQMLEQGLLEEVQGLIDEGYGEASALQSIGYRECAEHLGANASGSLEALCEEIAKNTARLAKRQMTWFRRDPEIHWVEAQDALQIDQALVKIERFFMSQ